MAQTCSPCSQPFQLRKGRHEVGAGLSLILLVPRMRTAVHDAVMHPESRLAHHCASAGLVQSEPVIEQAKKDAVPVGHGSPADPKRLARAGTSSFVLLSAGRGREQCGGDPDRSQESASLHCCSNAAAGAGVPDGKSSRKRPWGRGECGRGLACACVKNVELSELFEGGGRPTERSAPQLACP